MRIFVGVTLAEEVRSTAERVADELRQRLDARVRASWIPSSKMHLTVRFIGQVDDSRVSALLSALEPPLPIAPFEIALDGCGAFPRGGPPRVFWIGVGEGQPQLRAMHDECNRRLVPLGFVPEDRPFSAHLTLARVREAPRETVRATRDILGAVHVPAARCRVAHATVFQSRLSPKGSTYVPLLNILCQTANR